MQIKTLDEMSGKTIDRALLVSSDCMCLVFNDGSFSFIEAIDYCFHIKRAEPDPFEMLQAGLITRERYERKLEAREREAKKLKEYEDFQKYLELHERFGPIEEGKEEDTHLTGGDD